MQFGLIVTIKNAFIPKRIIIQVETHDGANLFQANHFNNLYGAIKKNIFLY